MLKTIIIDDESANREVLEIMLKDFPDDIQVVASCNGPKTGMTAILQHKPDLVFLDFVMPGMTGFDLLEMLGDTSIGIIFVTAHNHYALQAIQFTPPLVVGVEPQAARNHSRSDIVNLLTPAD